jgi:23S rRNA (adenine2503-C2)-methyltransferase
MRILWRRFISSKLKSLIKQMEKEFLFGKTLDELGKVAQNAGLPAYTAKQMASWLYGKNIQQIEEMTDISKKGRDYLINNYELGLYPHKTVQVSTDGTKKYLFPVGALKTVEAAYIPELARSTLCLSTQVGCKMGCLFCMTGKQGFQGNLSSGEILNQVKSLPEAEKLTNLVYMGMGEPLDNLDEVLKSIQILTASWGFAMSPRRITVSTIGIIPAMNRFIKESEAHLALSLHSPFDEERKKLMPVENVYPLKEVIAELKKTDWAGQRRISIEYIMFRGLNDTQEHVNELSRLLHGLRCRINLIRFHPIPDTPLTGTGNREMEAFRDALNQKGIIATIRRSRGEDIYAACGLLSTKNKLS